MSTFVDEASIEVVAGRGGRGSASFRREKYVPHGGPDGGDGGRGGDVRLVATEQETSLYDFRRKRMFKADNGGDGAGGKRHGKRGEDCVIAVPPGTMVRVEGKLVADLNRDGAEIVVARGGRGGLGNVHFSSSVHQAPRHAELGDPGETKALELELKLIADIGLVGLPNAGKSTLLAAWTKANPKIGAYPFTTLSPNLGVADIGDVQRVIIADVPGLIEGAHLGVGLGIEFLRHIERTRVLVHVVDVSVGEEQAAEALRTIEAELGQFSDDVGSRPLLLAFNKIDVDLGEATAKKLLQAHPEALALSALSNQGCQAALEKAAALVSEARAEQQAVAPSTEVHREYTFEAGRAPTVARDLDGFRVYAPDVQRQVSRTDTENEELLARLARIFRKSGVDDALRQAGCSDGDTVRIGDVEFTFVDERHRD